MVNLISNSPEEMIINDQLLEVEIKRILGNNGNRNGKKGKKFAVLLCAEDSEYVKKKYGGYFGVFVRMLGEEGESWDVFKVAQNEFPTEEEIENYDGFVITGSCSDAHSNHLWICRLLNLLITLDSLKKKVLGICFGHQVLELPPKVEVIGRSNKTSIEMFKYGDHMMGIQGHPEYNKDILLHLIDRLLQRKLITEAYANEMRVKFMESHDPDKEAWRKLCVNFLKGRL
ncbi:gamma-glutamyl peptidase 5-like isoform X2 [Amaranthus tricolor]|uniref:gamma-glutamyl peptidase 5-like isoform X2 n=1 Tax=Amaranthus tricolor TaxID=29722 RepID=UPI0025873253|nr:gamma-glutamyl peptidase 5-like isoform X2 [Amaranthus tricolor]